MIGTPAEPTADYIDSHADSRVWKHFRPRAGDIVVATPPKSGTTWMQAIVALLLSGDPTINVNPSHNAPWIDAASDVDEVMARIEAQTGRRHFKTHTPFDGIPVWPGLKYICVYRHPLDVFFSWRKHERNMTFEFEDLPVIEDPQENFRDYLDSAYRGSSGARLGVLVHHYRCAVQRDGLPNLLTLHYADMTRDLAGAMDSVANFLGITHPPEVMASLVRAATFDNMKANADRFVPAAGRDVWHTESAFFDSASSNKWEGKLSADDLAAYGARISQLLTPKERAWLEWGDAGWV